MNIRANSQYYLDGMNEVMFMEQWFEYCIEHQEIPQCAVTVRRIKQDSKSGCRSDQSMGMIRVQGQVYCPEYQIPQCAMTGLQSRSGCGNDQVQG